MTEINNNFENKQIPSQELKKVNQEKKVEKQPTIKNDLEKSPEQDVFEFQNKDKHSKLPKDMPVLKYAGPEQEQDKPEIIKESDQDQPKGVLKYAGPERKIPIEHTDIPVENIVIKYAGPEKP